MIKVNTPTRQRFFTYLPIYIFPIVLFLYPLINGLSFFWGTPSLQFIPWREYAFENLLRGILPLWNPLNGMGAPFLANYQLAIFYPPGWLLFIFWLFGGVSWLAWAHTLLVVLHLIWAGLGMSKLIKSLGFDQNSQTIGGIAFSLCTYWVARAGFFSMIWAGVWLTWIIYEITRLNYSEEGPKLRLVSTRLVIFVALQFLAGHAQLTFYTLVLASFWLLFRAWNLRGIYSGRKAIFCFAISVCLAFIIASIQLFPTAEFLFKSQRSSLVNYETALSYSFWPWRFLTFFAPDFFGNPGLNNYWGYGNYWEDAAYIGLLPLLLAISTLRIVFGKPDSKYPKPLQRTVIFLWVTVLVSSILALGKNTPIFPFLYKYIPTFNMFNAPARYMIWCVFSLTVLASIGVNFWDKPVGKGLYWLKLATAGGFAVTLGAIMAWFNVDGVNLTFIRSTIVTGIFALGVGLLTLTADRKTTSNFWIIAVVIWVGSDLLLAGWKLNPYVDMSFYSETINRPRLLEELGENRIYLNAKEEYRIKFKRFLRFDEYQAIENWINLRYALLPNLNLIEKLPMVNNFDPLLISRYVEWMQHVDSLSEVQREPWLKIMNVSVIERSDRNKPGGIRFDQFAGLGRFSWVGCVKNVKNSVEAWKEVVNGIEKDQMVVNNKLNFVVIEEEENVGIVCNKPARSSKITIIFDQPQRQLIQLESQEDGWLVIADTWYPGWRAKLDGDDKPIYKANYLFRAIRVPAGKHQVLIYYRPTWFYLGASLSILGLVFLLIRSIFITRSGENKNGY